MADANIDASADFIKHLEYKIQKLSTFVDQLDILVFSLRQLCLALNETCKHAYVKG